VAHTNARLATEINPAAAILATCSEMYGGLPEYLLFPFEFIGAFPCPYHESYAKHPPRVKHNERVIRSAATLFSFVLPDRVAALQNGNPCLDTNQLHGGRLPQCSGELQTLLRGSVSATEFIPMRFRICQS
jgi:hypothetical protein